MAYLQENPANKGWKPCLFSELDFVTKNYEIFRSNQLAQNILQIVQHKQLKSASFESQSDFPVR